MTAIARFLAKVRIDESGCWLWTGYRRLGYGQFGDGSRVVQADRWLWETERGLIPEGLQLDHLCRNRACVNLEHLEPVTQRTNILRGDGPSAHQARQTHCLRGHPLTGENLYERPDRRGRMCRVCRAASKRAFEERRRATA